MRLVPKRSRRFVAGIVAIGALAVGVGTALAVPLTYSAVLEDGVSVAGNVPNASIGNSALWDYYCFWASAGTPVALAGDRVDTGHDPAMTVFRGVSNETAGLSSGSSTQAGMTFVDFGDDEDPDPGPFGDPRVNFTPSANGRYTAAMFDFISDGSQADWDNTIVGTGLAQSTQADLSDARDDLGAIIPTLTDNQAVLRANTVYGNFLANAIADANTDGCGLGDVAAARQARQGFNYLRTPNAQLAAATVGVRADLYDAVERMADTRFGEVSDWGEAPQSLLDQAAGHIALAADNAGTDAGLVQLIKAIDILKGETPQIP